MSETWFRYDDQRFWEDQIMVILSEYPVLSHTPKGVWLDICGDKKFVLKNARKRWACPTETEARQSFLARKARQLKILCYQVERVQRAIAQMQTTEEIDHAPSLFRIDQEGKAMPQPGGVRAL